MGGALMPPQPPAPETRQPAGDVLAIVEASGARTTYAYDHLRRLVRVDQPAGTTHYTYGESDRLVGVDDRGISRRFEHDETGRITRIQPGDAGASGFR